MASRLSFVVTSHIRWAVSAASMVTTSRPSSASSASEYVSRPTSSPSRSASSAGSPAASYTVECPTTTVLRSASARQG
ncbi:hypothetical protein ACIBU0_36260 [Streptomyces sp. NPDC049627]|uniref:hypothetical protein n=1 Tax=Streptomyces sp. NPDC049627 TaxID=3365595 RepID=UPI00379AD544